MFFMRINDREVRQAIAYGEIIEENLENTPFPSYLILDFVGGRALHVYEKFYSWTPPVEQGTMLF